MKIDYPNRSLSKLFLMMGFDCNFKCKHCIQEPATPCNRIHAPTLSTDTLDYIQHLISIRPSQFPKLELVFWGGEPLLYMDIIKTVVSRFGDKLTYSMISNGSLLTEDIVDYLNTNDINYTVSYDGKDTAKVRQVNIFENNEKLELFKNIANKGICSVLSAYNYDLAGLFHHIRNELGLRDIPISIEPLRITWDMPADLYQFNMDDFKQKLHGFAQQALIDILNANPSDAAMFFYTYLNRLCTPCNTNLRCMQTYRVLNIDLTGKIHPCHNTSELIGDTNTYRVLICEAQDAWVKNNMPTACPSCIYYPLCSGGCPNELILKNGERASCTINKVIFDETIWIAKTIEKSFVNVDLEV